MPGNNIGIRNAERNDTGPEILCIPHSNRVNYVNRISRKEFADGVRSLEKTLSFYTKVF